MSLVKTLLDTNNSISNKSISNNKYKGKNRGSSPQPRIP